MNKLEIEIKRLEDMNLILAEQVNAKIDEVTILQNQLNSRIDEKVELKLEIAKLRQVISDLQVQIDQDAEDRRWEFPCG